MNEENGCSNAAFVPEEAASTHPTKTSIYPAIEKNNSTVTSTNSTTSSIQSKTTNHEEKKSHPKTNSTDSNHSSHSSHSKNQFNFASSNSAANLPCSATNPNDFNEPPPPYTTIEPSRSSDTTSTISRDPTDQKPHDGASQPEQGTYRLYKSRYYVLMLYSFVLFYQCAIWNTWGPISATALAVFPSWTEATIATFANWGPIMFVLSVIPTSWAIERWGLRAVTVTYTGCTALAHVLRCVTTQETLFTVFANICGIVNGIEATIVLAAAALPAVWFPAAQRVTATAFSQVLNVMGSGASFMQPLVVAAPSNDTTVEEMTRDIRTLMIIEMSIAASLFLLVLAYFPSAPPSPPSPSSTVERLGFKEGFRSILKSRQFWQLLPVYAIYTGISMVWIGVISFSLQELGIDQDEAVWIGIYNSFCMGIVCLLTSRLMDLVYGHLKVAMLCLMTVSSMCYIWFMLLTLDVIPVTHAQVYITVLGGQSFNFACSPLFMELAVEAAYPSPESAVGTIMTLSNNLTGALFLFLFYIPGISDNGDAWMTYLLVASNVGAIIPVLLYKQEFKRSRLDRASLNASS